MVQRTKIKLVYGVGVNDSEQPISQTIGGVKVTCHYYKTWKKMLERCYSEKWHARKPSYSGCTVCPEWHSFTRFKAWMEAQDWVGNQLDKDLLFEGNRVYDPETCLFVPPLVNKFIVESKTKRGDWPMGVHFSKREGKFAAQVSLAGLNQKHIGYFDCPEEAHREYKSYKRQLAIELSKVQSDNRVSEALLLKYV